jgi:hypothetical protein
VGDLIVTEFLRDPSRVLDSDGEWFEVYNTTGTDIRMCDWRIADTGSDAFTMTSDLLVPAGDYAVLGRSTDTSRNGGATVDYAYALGMSLGNGTSDEIILSHDGAEIDRVAYTTGWPLFGGRSTALRPAGYSASGNDSAANWCLSTSAFGLGDKGTPGAANDPC